ncbi:hypothetical protein SALWKB12_2062 [Snodgrassella communis]|uniref:Uncharacterized protein n=1 Tax=Snodgrassella communis TaxID=2946699 RepID=A0A836MPV0_9NEIS|nr:hypothetical protein SALWKB12_2062 [Snodgrassella communis]KDN14324.1 hypothetical protein SALWKB29_1626 [Snodgrassella communis]
MFSPATTYDQYFHIFPSPEYGLQIVCKSLSVSLSNNLRYSII